MTTPRGRALNPGGWRTFVHQAAVPAAPTAPPKREKERAPIPGTLSQYAPLLLACRFCMLPQLATPAGVLLWHRMEWRGEHVECTGTNTLGLPLEEVGQ